MENLVKALEITEAAADKLGKSFTAACLQFAADLNEGEEYFAALTPAQQNTWLAALNGKIEEIQSILNGALGQ